MTTLNACVLDAKANIQAAYERAKRNGTPRYVVAEPDGFSIVWATPAASLSHWKVMPDGTVYAHLSNGPHDGTHRYEEVR